MTYKIPDEIENGNPSKEVCIDANRIRGYGIVTDIAERNAIPEDLRKVGGQYTVGTKAYIYNGSDITDTNWLNSSNWVLGGGAQITTDLSDMPSMADKDAAFGGEKLILDKATGEYILAPSTTSSGFYDVENVAISFDGSALSLNPVVGSEFKFVTSNGTEYSKTTDSIALTYSNDGLYYVYYDDNGVLQQLNQPSVSTQKAIMQTTLPVSYITYNNNGNPATLITFVGNYMKGRVGTGLWVKNFYDQQVYSLGNGILLSNDPTGGDGNSNDDVRVGLTSGELAFVTNKYTVPERLVTDTWNVGYTASNQQSTGVSGSAFLAITDVDLGIGATGRILYNNNGNPTAVPSGSYVWYFIGFSVDFVPADRTLSLMGEAQYTTVGSAVSALESEIATIESKQLIKQGFAVRYAVLLQTKDNYTNALKSLIEQVELVTKTGSTTTPIQAGVTPAGNIGDVQFNDGAGDLAADANFNWNATNKILELVGKLTVEAKDGTRQNLIEAIDTGLIEQFSVDSEAIVRIKEAGAVPVSELGYMSLYYNTPEDVWYMVTNGEAYRLNTDKITRLVDTNIATQIQGDGILFDADQQKYVGNGSVLDTDFLPFNQLAITGTSPYEVELNDSLLGSYSIKSFKIKNNDAVNSVSVVLSSLAGGGGDILASTVIAADSTSKVESFVKTYFEEQNDTPVFIQLTSVGTPDIDIIPWTITNK